MPNYALNREQRMWLRKMKGREREGCLDETPPLSYFFQKRCVMSCILPSGRTR